MYFDIQTDSTGGIVDISLKASAYETSDHLHDLSAELRVLNPCINFSEQSREGFYDDISDEEYRRTLTVFKLISSELFQKEGSDVAATEINIFELLVRVMKKYVQQLESYHLPGD